ncbi:protein of unknown function [Candidatus Methylomirabilis oxygeniifera]|uniref:Uncharacterized protein n=1 Tax=Methylomirabilis oxygeniifera TaxID=671143 RepID=D5MI27_METO1|nr:protein of unknown function [Candidatus Methylomirabilis oxyfera]
MDLSSELLRVRTQFEEAERVTDPAKKCRALQKALDTLEVYEEDHPAMKSSEKTILGNLRRSHARRLLSQLVSMPNVEIEIWLEYILLFVFRLKDDVEHVLQQHPELRKNYAEFKEIYKKEIAAAAKELLSKQP